MLRRNRNEYSSRYSWIFNLNIQNLNKYLNEYLIHEEMRNEY